MKKFSLDSEFQRRCPRQQSQTKASHIRCFLLGCHASGSCCAGTVARLRVERWNPSQYWPLVVSMGTQPEAPFFHPGPFIWLSRQPGHSTRCWGGGHMGVGGSEEALAADRTHIFWFFCPRKCYALHRGVLQRRAKNEIISRLCGANVRVCPCLMSGSGVPEA